MKQTARVRWIALASLGLFAIAGCDGTPHASSSTDSATVKGKVTRKGKPLAKIQVMFNPANINRKSAPSAIATADAEGHYQLTTLVGENAVSLVGAEASKINTLSGFNKAVNLTSGENTVDLAVP